MEPASLRRFEPLYLNAQYFGAAETLRAHLSLAPDFPIPLSLAHGVDFGHVNPCQDLLGIEPIHWAHNHRILRAASAFKPALAIPHPFLLAMQRQPRNSIGKRTLVVGPPPGPINDERLFALLTGERASELTILIKPKRGYRHSMDFWQSRGFTVATLSDFGPANYETMARMLTVFGRVVGCTFSSLVVFAAGAGLEVELLRDYSYDCYDLIEFGSRFEVIDWSSHTASKIVRIFLGGDRMATGACAVDVLGGTMESDPAVIRKQLAEAIAALREPVYWRNQHSRLVRRAGREIAAALQKPGVLRFNPRSWLRRRFNPQVWARDINEIGAWLDGGSAASVRQQRRAYQRGLTEPGDAVNAYPH